MSNMLTLKLEAAITDNNITMCVYEDGSTLPHYDQTSVSLQEVFLLCDEIVKLLNKANGAVGRSSGVNLELKKAGQCLYDQLLTESAKKKFKASKAVNLEIYIDEGLVSIPWELLFDGTQFLSLRFNIGRKVKTRQPTRSSGERTCGFPIKMLILADPTNDLPIARQEAGVIEKQLDGMRKLIAVAKKVTNIDPVYVKKNLREYDIVHYAGHADHNPANPSQSGWKLSGGQFTAEDIAKMGETSPLPSLIFSNACRSAQTEEWVGGDFETQVFGLANAFLCAGVRHYIGTSWKIPDDISLAFAKEFYAQLAQSKSVGEAIRLARLLIIKEQGEDSIVWASYVLYGDPTSTLFTSMPKYSSGMLISVLLRNKLLIVFSLICGIGWFIWPYFVNGFGSEKNVLINHYYQQGWQSKTDGHFLDAERLLKKALMICDTVRDCNKAPIKDAIEELQAVKLLDSANKKKDSNLRIQATLDLARIKSKRFFKMGLGEEGSQTEVARKAAIEAQRSVFNLLDGKDGLTKEQTNILAESLYSLVMLFIPNDIDRAEFYYDKLLLTAQHSNRFEYLKQISERVVIFQNASISRSPCQGVLTKKALSDAGLNADVVFEKLAQEDWVDVLSSSDARVKVDLMTIKDRLAIIFPNNTENEWAKAPIGTFYKQTFFTDGNHSKRVHFVMLGTCSIWSQFSLRITKDMAEATKPILQPLMAEINSKRELQEQEAKNVIEARRAKIATIFPAKAVAQIESFEKTIQEIISRNEENEDLAIGYEELAAIYFDYGYLDEAERYAMKSIDIAERHNFQAVLAMAYPDLVDVYIQKKQWNLLDVYYKKYEKVQRAIGNIQRLGTSNVIFGTALVDVSNFEAGRTLLIEGVSILKEIKTPDSMKVLLVAYEGLTRLYNKQKDLSQALLFASELESLAVLVNNNKSIYAALMYKAMIYEQQHEYVKAIEALNRVKWMQDKLDKFGRGAIIDEVDRNLQRLEKLLEDKR